MPVDDDLATSEPANEPYKCESGDTRWVLNFCSSDFTVLDVICVKRTYLNHDEFRRVIDTDHERC